MMRPIPVEHYLTPEPAATAPADFTVIDQQIVQGLPHTIKLTDHLGLTLLLPNGLAHEWRDADPEAIVSRSADERQAATAAQIAARADLPRPPLRVMVQLDGVLQESVAVVAGGRVPSPRSGRPDRGVRLELVFLSWLITAGTVRGLGDYGSRIRLAWRARGAGVDDYAIPPVNPNIVPRLAVAQVFIPLVVQPVQFYTVVYSAVAVQMGG